MRRNSSAGGSRPRPLFFGLNLAIGAIVLAGALLLFPPVSPSPHYDYKLGDVTQTGEEVIAPVSFPVPVSAVPAPGPTSEGLEEAFSRTGASLGWAWRVL